MPNRIIKESITTSDTINSLTPEEECFFYRLITKCDDFGRFDARPAVIRAACFPLKVDGISEDDVQRWLLSLARVGIVMLYEHDGRPYLQLVTWEKHQQKRARKSKYPNPSDNTCKQLISDDCKCPRETRNEKREYENTRNDYEKRDGEVEGDVVSEWVDLFGIIGPKQLDDLEFWVSELDKSLVLEAIKITAEQRDQKRITGPPFAYMLGILRGWRQNGITSLADLQERESSPGSDRADHEGAPSEFEGFWTVYPKRIGKLKALERWRQVVDDGVEPEDLMAAAKHYGQLIRAEDTDEKFIKYPANWLKDGEYREYLDPGGGWKTETLVKAERIISLAQQGGIIPEDVLVDARWILEGDSS